MSHAAAPSQTASARLEIFRLRRKLWQLVCSADWFDRCRAEFEAGRLKERKRPDRALDRAEIYPPGGAPRRGQHRSLMRHCSHCGQRWIPPQYLRGSGMCEDCVAAINVPVTDEKTHVSSTQSPTAETLRLLEHYQIRLVEPRLPAEDEATLRRQIADYQRQHPPTASFTPSKNTKKHVCK